MAEDSSFRTSYIEGVSKFQASRSRAFLQEMLSLLRGQSAELLSFEDIRQRLRLREESYRGLQDIPLEKIKGSVGRYKDFTTSFLPRNNEIKDRWSRVYAAMNSMQGAPPIDVYKVGDVYFVRDGNHRVSVARQIGAKTIQAHVTELPTSVQLTPDMSLEEIDAAAAYAAFLDETGLRDARPHHVPLQLSEPSRYPELVEHIYLHQKIMEQRLGKPVSTAEAAADWYDNMYRPAVTLIRKYNMLDRIKEKGRTEADLYIWMVNHLRELRRQYGEETRTRRFSDALVDYLAEKKIPIPRELLEEKDESVVISRSQVREAIRQEREQEQQREQDESAAPADTTDEPQQHTGPDHTSA